jgi:outer membrane lipoprotein SlyB
MRGRIFTMTLGLQLLAIGCAAQRPVLYPNAELKRVGTSAADRDIDDCMKRAEEYVRSDGQAAQTLEHAGVSAGTGAAIGAAAGGAGGAVLGRAGTGAAVGAAGGGAAGATRAVVHELFRKRDPSPVYRNFVNRCLREKGYEPIGWK